MDFFAANYFVLASGGAIELDFADVAADLRAVSARIHAQRSANAAGNADEAFHSAEIIFRAKSDRAAEIRCGVDEGRIAFDAHAGLGGRKVQHDPGQLAIGNEDVGTAAEKFVSDAFALQLANHVRQRLIAANEQKIGGAADAERGQSLERNAGAQLDAESGQARGDGPIANAHGSPTPAIALR